MVDEGVAFILRFGQPCLLLARPILRESVKVGGRAECEWVKGRLDPTLTIHAVRPTRGAEWQFRKWPPGRNLATRPSREKMRGKGKLAAVYMLTYSVFYDRIGEGVGEEGTDLFRNLSWPPRTRKTHTPPCSCECSHCLPPRCRLSSGMTRLRSVTRRRCVAPLPASHLGPSWPISPSDRCCCALFQMMRQQMLRQQQQQGQQQQQYARAAQQQQAQQDALLRAQVQSLGSHNPPKIRHPVYPMPLHRSARR